jgi:hypothetical protein
MKKIAVLGIVVALLILPLLSACGTDTEISSISTTGETSTSAATSLERTPIPAGTYTVSTFGFTAPDDLFATPGGIAYAANVHGGGMDNPWLPIEIVDAEISGNTTVQYRSDIESKAGETRHNIFYVSKLTTGHFENNKLVLYSNSVPDGISLAYSGGAGLPGSLQAILMISISPQLAPGDYSFRIFIEIDGKDYGSLPCRIKVIA